MYSYNAEVLKLWVRTQTWVALASSLGRGPFCDKKKEQINYHYKQTKTRQFCTTWIKMSKITPNFDKCCAAQQSSPLLLALVSFFSFGSRKILMLKFGRQKKKKMKTPDIMYDILKQKKLPLT